jgi:hypothetical protein
MEAKRQAAKDTAGFLGTVSGPQVPVDIGLPDVPVPEAFQGSLGARMPQTGTFEGPMGLPGLTHTMEYPGYGQIDVPSREGNFLQTVQEVLRKAEAERTGRQVDVPPSVMSALNLPERVDPSVLQATTQLATVRPTEGDQDRRLAYDAFAAKLGKTADQLTPAERVKAQGEFRTQTTPPDPSLAGFRATQEADVRFRQANTLRDDFQKEAGRFAQIQTTIGQARQLAADKTATSDHALIFNFVRALDEVPSVVRAEEYKAAGNLGSLKQRVEGQIARVVKGDLMDDSVRRQIVRTLDIVERGVSQARQRAVVKYRGIAKRNGLDARDVFGEDPMAAAGAGSAAGGASGHGAPVASRRLSNGQTEYRDANGATWVQ